MQNKSGENCSKIENFTSRAKLGRCRLEEEWGVVSKRLTPRQRRRGESWCGVAVWRGVPNQVSYSSSDRGSKLRSPSQRSPLVASKRDVNIAKLMGGKRHNIFSNTAKPLLQFPPLLKMSLTTASPYLRCNSGTRGETLERESTGSVTSADDIASADEFRPSAHGHRGKLFRDGIYHLERLFLHCRMKYDEDEKLF
ncbi:hypothetical protein AVEN_269529-1 [Araneus ventricosus]|uniref:Uncharacterized protein n=1 Tax=Araneus ventricosus TaxID=182803 RepID=A0A4Y2U6U0_ARAVE|nr:hypothetical protein AVEN_269529-1 [Araneus ventricosus]